MCPDGKIEVFYYDGIFVVPVMGDKPPEVGSPILQIPEDRASECHSDFLTRGIRPHFESEMDIVDCCL